MKVRRGVVSVSARGGEDYFAWKEAARRVRIGNTKYKLWNCGVTEWRLIQRGS